MTEYRNWVHGSDVNVRFPDRVSRLQRGSTGTFVQQAVDTSNRFYFAVPTPTGISDDETIEIEEAYLQAELSGAIITAVTIHEGTTQIFSETTAIEGPDVQRTFNPEDKIIGSAINFGVEIEFNEADQIEGNDPGVNLVAAGAQFDTFSLIRPFFDDDGVIAPE